METEQEFKTTMKVVEKVLMTEDRARNSDKWLVIAVLREMGFKIFIDYNELDNMPSFETITRCSRKLRETNKDLEPDEDVQELRSKRQDFIQEFMPDKPRFVQLDNFVGNRVRGVTIESK